MNCSRSLNAIVGDDKGRSVVISPMSGVIVIRAMPDELRNVSAYLKASQISVERQVILEAKIVEVQLNDSFQSGVNWAAFKNGPNSSVVRAGADLPRQRRWLLPGALSNGLTDRNAGFESVPGSNVTLPRARRLPAHCSAWHSRPATLPRC